MTIHYHGTPITPRSVLQSLAGKHFCVSFARPENVQECHRIGQGVMLDNGAYSFWRKGQTISNWEKYYRWAHQWLAFHTTWAVIPDIIGGTEGENDFHIPRAIREFGSNRQIAPVWHLHESFERLEGLVCRFDRVCFGSSAEFSKIGTNAWNNRVNEAFNRICRGSGRPPAAIHMLRGMSLAASAYPFASLDSTDVAQNHSRTQNTAKGMADRWDALQCPARWEPRELQQELTEALA